jgi:hypothetical protein
MRIRDPIWRQFGSGIRDKHPGSATLQKKLLFFRTSDESFVELSRGAQSGGEKSVSTAVYMMALQASGSGPLFHSDPAPHDTSCDFSWQVLWIPLI